MGRYILRRLLQLIPVFIGSTFLIYALVWALPGDPFAGKCGQRACPQPYVDMMTAKYNLNDSLVVQYFKYLGNLFSGDFGETFSGNSIGQMVADAAPITIRLAVIAVIIEAVIGIGAGILTGLRGKGFLDNLVLVSTLFLISLPVFVTGIVLQLVLAGQWGIINPSVSADATVGELIVPGFVLGSLSMAYIARLTRASISENRRADFVRTAIAKGQPNRRVVGVHLLRASVNINGLGGLVFRGIQEKDGATVTGIVVLLVIVYLLMSLVVDLMYAVLDPRIRYD